MEGLLYLLVLGAVIALTVFVSEVAVPYFLGKYSRFHDKRAAKFTAQMEESFIFWETKRMMMVALFPFIFAAIGMVVSRNIIGLGAGFGIGLIFPNIMLVFAKQQRLRKFRGQLVDSLMILSSSIKAGLSFLQAMEVLCEEMPAPMSQEFGLILNENKLGVSLEDSLRKLRRRVPIEETNLIVSSILIARESGGDLPRVLSRLTETIRDNLKLKEKIDTLTLQGRLQGVIMVFLPIAFTYFIYTRSPGHFDVMLQTELGKKLIFTAVTLQIVGMFLIKKISTMRI